MLGGGGLYTGCKRIEGTGNKFSFILYACNHYTHTQNFHRLLYVQNTYTMGTFIAICC